MAEEAMLKKYEVVNTEYEVKNYNGNVSAFFNVFKYDFISNIIKQNKIWEHNLHYVFERYINKNSVVLEGGCHIGTHSIKLSMLAKQVHCFEPLRESNTLLRKNIHRNECTNSIVYNEALSDIEGTSNFDWMPIYNLGASGLKDNPMGIPDADVLTTQSEKYEVKTITIDSLNLNKLDFIKLDVEGYETKVIRGAMNTIKKHKPVIVLECWLNHNFQTDYNHTKEQFKKLLELNYSIKQIGPADWLFLPDTHNTRLI